MKREYNIRILLGIALLLLGIAVEIIWNGVYSPLTRKDRTGMRET